MIYGNKGRPRWGDLEYLVADQIKVWTGKDHPSRPKPVAKPKGSAARDRKIAQLKRQFAARRKAIEAGQIQ